MNSLKIFSGESNKDLANDICKDLSIRLSDSNNFKFSNGEIGVCINESVRGDDVYIVQSTYTNESILELLIMIDALKRASARRITAIIPYFGYARQDRKARSREPITAKLIANLLTTSGVNRILTCDLHTDQLQGFFDIPVDHLTAIPLLANYFKEDLKVELQNNNVIVVSPDHGSVIRSRRFAKLLNCDLAIVDKRRNYNIPNQSEVINIIGDIKEKICILVDDMIDTGGTIVNAANTLVSRGSWQVFACATHGVLSGKYDDLLTNSKLEKVIFTNTIPEKPLTLHHQYLNIANLFAHAIKRIHMEESISDLF